MSRSTIAVWRFALYGGVMTLPSPVRAFSGSGCERDPMSTLAMPISIACAAEMASNTEIAPPRTGPNRSRFLAYCQWWRRGGSAGAHISGESGYWAIDARITAGQALASSADAFRALKKMLTAAQYRYHVHSGW